MQIKQDFIPVGRKNRPGNKMSPKYITVHNTANTAKSASAEMHARYVKNPTTTESWHYTVDDGDVIYQHLPTNESGWHAGDGVSGAGNRQSIGIEICEYEGINANTANNNAAWLIKRLMKDYNISIANVVPHQKWSGKYCPRKLLPIWPSFIGKINGADDTQVYPLKSGDKGALVSKLQIDLNKLGYKLTIDGIFGSATEAAVKSFQKSVGLVVDGLAGSATMAALLVAINKPTPPKEEETYLKLNKSQTEELAGVFKYAREKGIFSSAAHEKDVLDGKMTHDKAIYLTALIAGAALNGGNRIN